MSVDIDSLQTEVQRLHRIPKNQKIYQFDESSPIIYFKHIDGAFSYCLVDDDPEKVVHLSAMTPVVKYKDGYKLVRSDHE